MGKSKAQNRYGRRRFLLGNKRTLPAPFFSVCLLVEVQGTGETWTLTGDQYWLPWLGMEGMEKGRAKPLASLATLFSSASRMRAFCSESKKKHKQSGAQSTGRVKNGPSLVSLLRFLKSNENPMTFPPRRTLTNNTGSTSMNVHGAVRRLTGQFSPRGEHTPMFELYKVDFLCY